MTILQDGRRCLPTKRKVQKLLKELLKPIE
jgi:hypothetical protein